MLESRSFARADEWILGQLRSCYVLAYPTENAADVDILRTYLDVGLQIDVRTFDPTHKVVVRPGLAGGAQARGSLIDETLLGVEAQARGDYEQAEARYAAASRIRAEDPTALYAMGILRLMLGEARAASVLLERSVRSSPWVSRAWAALPWRQVN